MPKKITLESLATMIQGEFSSLREGMTSIEESMATKSDLKKLEKSLALRHDDTDTKFATQSNRWQEDFEELEGRVSRAERDVVVLSKAVFKKR